MNHAMMTTVPTGRRHSMTDVPTNYSMLQPFKLDLEPLPVDFTSTEVRRVSLGSCDYGNEEQQQQFQLHQWNNNMSNIHCGLMGVKAKTIKPFVTSRRHSCTNYDEASSIAVCSTMNAAELPHVRPSTISHGSPIPRAVRGSSAAGGSMSMNMSSALIPGSGDRVESMATSTSPGGARPSTSSPKSGPVRRRDSGGSVHLMQQNRIQRRNSLGSPTGMTMNKGLIPITKKPTIVKKSASTVSAKGDSIEGGKHQQVLLSKPKRALSAYNIFFRYERAKLLGSDEVPNHMRTEEDDDRTKKRPHRKTHGKVGFTQLAKHCADKWKSMTTEEKQFYEEKADEEKKRYLKAMDRYNKALEAAGLSPADVSNGKGGGAPKQRRKSLNDISDDIRGIIRSLEPDVQKSSSTLSPGVMGNSFTHKTVGMGASSNAYLQEQFAHRRNSMPDLTNESDSSPFEMNFSSFTPSGDNAVVGLSSMVEPTINFGDGVLNDTVVDDEVLSFLKNLEGGEAVRNG